MNSVVLLAPGQALSPGKRITILDLSRFRHLFLDDAHFDQFVSALLGKLTAGGTTVLTNGDFAIATMYSAADAKEAFQLRIAAKLAENPDLLDELKSRAEDGEFVEYGKIDVPDQS